MHKALRSSQKLDEKKAKLKNNCIKSRRNKRFNALKYLWDIVYSVDLSETWYCK